MFYFNSDDFQTSFTSQCSRIRMSVLEYWLCTNCVMLGKLLHLYDSILPLQNEKDKNTYYTAFVLRVMWDNTCKLQNST